MTARVALATLGGWFAAVLFSFAALFAFTGAMPSGADMAGFTTASLAAVGFLVPLLYLPGVLWLRRARGDVDPFHAALFCATVLNLPIFGVVAAASVRGWFGAGEAFVFAAIFAGVAAVFGRSAALAVRRRS
jgi:hypothetical protein